MRGRRSTKGTTQKWVRQLHSWTSMVCLLVVLFFAVTGVTLNHPSWFGASEPRTTTSSGQLADVQSGDLLAISEAVRSEAGVTGSVSSHTENGTQGEITYEGPGSVTVVSYDTTAHTYSVRTTSYGLVGVLNDLHKGRHTGTSFSWVIDASGVLLSVVSLTGLLLQTMIRRRRELALGLLGLGSLTLVALMVVNW